MIRVTGRQRLTLCVCTLTASIVCASAQPTRPADLSAFDTGAENHAALAFAPDGASAYWVAWNGRWGSSASSRRIIYASHYRNGAWSTPEPAPFSDNYSDDDPFVSPDGQWLYFVSTRATSEDDDSSDADIWRYSLVEDDRLEHLSVNSSAEEYSPIVTTSGALYFASNREGGPGQGDVYRAEANGDGFLASQPLGPAINTPTGEWNLWVSADESEMIIEASSRSTNVSDSGDLYYSWQTTAGWSHATPLAPLNSGNSELMARPGPDDRFLYYTTASMGGNARIAAKEWAPLRKQARAGYAPTLLVANRSSHEVTFVDLASAEIVARIATGEGPHLLSNVSDGLVLATGFGEFPRPHSEPVAARPPFIEVINSNLTLIDTVSRSVLLDTIIEDCAKPHASWIVGQRAYVSCEPANRVAVIDLDNGKTIAQFDTGQKGSHVLSFEPSSRMLAASNTTSGSVTLIEIDSGDARVVDLAAGSEGSLAVGGRIWIANAFDNSISIVDPRIARVVGHIDSVCEFPIALSEDSRNDIWVACFASRELVAVAPGDLSIRRRIPLDEQPLNVLIHPRRMLAYASLPRQNAVAEISLDSGLEVRRIPVGIEPDGLRWAEAIESR